ncbi:putative ribosomal protein L2 [Helianthus annuus]|uniref:Ribosomal protein L2 n=1 Tax=Helianthus annuus TaxID=4232 RepID=A0A251SG54_HELAN|nr:putative ribosomal protein L2 [Helianthus annuus]KAJ0463920.1 putative ribosomal protein L2 [Helianthus annuus]KAJ0468250.1 putative ribosomal protein L2 [Helianthus annuus]KAJ0485421.1 putative ribosomal protein L2 [Helianthus annuus]KAJ0655972.1 putative ribosomal protein L2 [Helianthus annuus]
MRLEGHIEITLGNGGQLARAAGAVAKLIAKEGKSATLKLPSGEVRLISKNCSATVGQVGNVGVNQKNLGRVGSKRWLGKRPVVRGVVMNFFTYIHWGLKFLKIFHTPIKKFLDPPLYIGPSSILEFVYLS